MKTNWWFILAIALGAAGACRGILDGDDRLGIPSAALYAIAVGLRRDRLDRERGTPPAQPR